MRSGYRHKEGTQALCSTDTLAVLKGSGFIPSGDSLPVAQRNATVTM